MHTNKDESEQRDYATSWKVSIQAESELITTTKTGAKSNVQRLSKKKNSNYNNNNNNNNNKVLMF